MTIRRAETGKTQTLVSNKIHPFFVQLPEGASPVRSSEGHRYDGDIARGAWVDASELKAGYRLLNDDGSWAVVGGVTVVHAPLTAYNLTVNGMHTYFVSGNAEASPVWVHNDCLIDVPAGSTDLGNGKYRTPNGEVATRAADGKLYIIKGPSQSPIWQGFKNEGDGVRSSGTGSKKQFFKWDHLHNDIEVYNSKDIHLGSMDPVTGKMYKPPVPGRKR